MYQFVGPLYSGGITYRLAQGQTAPEPLPIWPGHAKKTAAPHPIARIANPPAPKATPPVSVGKQVKHPVR